MNLDINTYLPNSDGNWKIKHNMIYYHRYVDIPVFKIEDDIFWVSLDLRIRKPVIKMITHLTKLGIDFFLTMRSDFHKKLPQDDLEGIITNYLHALTSEDFFDEIFDTGFDFVKSLTDFMTKYNCHGLMKEPYEYYKDKYLKTYYDWYTSENYYIMKREDMRDFLRTLEREIKLNLFL
jgi:hypothetical protein